VSGRAVQGAYGIGPLKHKDHGFESRLRPRLSALCCPLQVQALRYLDSLYKDSCQNVNCSQFKLILNRNSAEGLICVTYNNSVVRQSSFSWFIMQQPPIQLVPGALSLGVKRPGCEADYSPPYSARKRTPGATPPLPQYVFMAWYLVKRRDNFTFTFTFYICLHNMTTFLLSRV
jgi:hypothetical protein